MLKNMHFEITNAKGEKEVICLTDLFNTLLDFIMAIVKVEFAEFEEVTK